MPPIQTPLELRASSEVMDAWKAGFQETVKKEAPDIILNDKISPAFETLSQLEKLPSLRANAVMAEQYINYEELIILHQYIEMQKHSKSEKDSFIREITFRINCLSNHPLFSRDCEATLILLSVSESPTIKEASKKALKIMSDSLLHRTRFENHRAITIEWEATNFRRHELIDKKLAGSLIPEEGKELEHLKKLARERRQLVMPLPLDDMRAEMEELKRKEIWMGA